MNSPNPNPRWLHRSHGVALLLVLIALCVGTILTAGFLATQSTSIGISRNERDQARCRALAESGCEMGMSLVRNKTNWRETLTPGNWLTNYPLGGGTVTVTVTDSAGANNFTTDVTHGVVFTATATYNGRSYTVSSSMTPTGGGTPFSGGVFCAGPISLNGTASVDSYNSSVGPYAMTKASNALFWSNATNQPTLILNGLVTYKGSLVISPLQLMANAISLLNGAVSTPSSTSPSLEPRVAGNVIPPNTTGFTDANTSITKSGTQNFNNPQTIYHNFTISGTSTALSNITFTSPATYYVTGDLTIDVFSTMTISASSVTFIVDNNVNLPGKIVVNTGSKLQIYFNQNVDVTGTAGSALRTTDLQLLGSNTAGSVNVRNLGNFNGVIMAPNSSVLLQNFAKLYGSVVAHDLTMKDSSQFHQDAKAQSVSLHNVTGGSYMGDYRVVWQQ